MTYITNLKALIITGVVILAFLVVVTSNNAPHLLLCLTSIPALIFYLVGAKKWGWLWLWRKCK